MAGSRQYTNYGDVSAGRYDDIARSHECNHSAATSQRALSSTRSAHRTSQHCPLVGIVMRSGGRRQTDDFMLCVVPLRRKMYSAEYPASSVLRTSPPPASALSDRHRSQVGRHDRPRHRASRVARAFLVYMLSPLPRHSDWRSCFAHLSASHINLPRHSARVGLCIGIFEDCSVFTRVTACTLALSPYFVTSFTQRLQPFRCLHSCSGCFRLEQFAGWGFHPLGSAALSRRTPGAVSRAHISIEPISACARRPRFSITITRRIQIHPNWH
jgi:hypothetical protein